MIIRTLLLVALGITFAGCQTEGPSARIAIAGGQRITVSVKTGLVEGAKSMTATVETAALMTNREKKEGVYTFGLKFSHGVVPRAVKVEDVSETPRQLMCQDDQPALANQRWRYTSKPINPAAESMQWLHQIDESFRVYLFTITLQDGQTDSFYYAALYPAYIKPTLLSALGLGEP